MLARMSLALSELARTIPNLIGLGTIAEADPSSARVRVNINGRVTAWLPVPADIGHNYRRWRPLRVGTQVVVACPSGDPANAVIIQILYSDPLPPPSNSDAVDLILWNDGTRIEYDAAAQVMTVHSAGDLTLSAVGSIRLDAQHVEIHTGEEGRYLVDHHGKASMITHVDGPNFETETWETGAVVTGIPDHGYSPPKVSPEGSGSDGPEGNT